jgi:hypothetical protein
MTRKKKAEPSQKRARVVMQQPGTTVEIVPMEAQIAPVPTPEQLLDSAARQITLRKGYVKLIAASVRPEEVLVFGGADREEVYLPERICRSILNWTRCKVSFRGQMEEHRYDSPDGQFIEFVQNAVVIDPTGFEMSILGNRSTRDEFFGVAGKTHKCSVCQKDAKYDFPWEGAKYKGYFCPDHPKAKIEDATHWLPLWDVDLASVRKSAITNLWNGAVKAIGLQPTLLDLKEAGMEISKVQHVAFGSKREPKQPGAGEKPKTPQNSPPASKPAPQPKQDEQPKASAQPAAAPKGNEPAPTDTNRHETPAPSGPPRAEIPTDGVIDIVYNQGQDGKALISKKGSPYRKLVISGNTYFLFDNKQMPIDDGRVKTPLFELLDEAKKGTPVQFIAKEGSQGRWGIERVMRIGNLEWSEDGVPVLRREPPTREPGEETEEQQNIPY